MHAQQEIWSDAERRSFLLPERLYAADWADKYLRLDASSPEPGRFRTNRLEYLREPINTVNDPTCRECILMAGAQAGKTTCMHVQMGYTIAVAPAPSMFAMADKESITQDMGPRLEAFIKGNPALMSMVVPGERSLQGLRWEFLGMFLKFAWAGSPSRMATTPIQRFFADELDKWPLFSGSESDPEALGDRRLSNFRERFACKGSTPVLAKGRINTNYKNSDQRAWHVPCPTCKKYQVLDFKNLIWEGGSSALPDPIEIHNAAWFVCVQCKDRIYQKHQVSMNDQGIWVPKGGKIDGRGKLTGSLSESLTRGYHFWQGLNPMVKWGTIAADWIKACGEQNDDLRREKQMEFVNQVKGLPYEKTVSTITVRKMTPLERPYELEQVPSDVIVLTAGVDCQKRGDKFWCSVRGHSWGSRSYLIWRGHFQAWDDLIPFLLHRKFKRLDRRVDMPIRLSCIDSSWNTDEVYLKCRTDELRLKPVKGLSDRTAGGGYRTSAIDKIHKKTGKRIHGMDLFLVDTNDYKDRLAAMISPASNRIVVGDDVASDYNYRWFLPEGIDKEYVDGVASEHAVERRHNGKIQTVWVRKHGVGLNHPLDCEVYNLVAADILGVPRINTEAHGRSLLPPFPNVRPPAPVEDEEDYLGDVDEDWLG